jgi:RHS repeat-associated protein
MVQVDPKAVVVPYGTIVNFTAFSDNFTMPYDQGAFREWQINSTFQNHNSGSIHYVAKANAIVRAYFCRLNSVLQDPCGSDSASVIISDGTNPTSSPLPSISNNTGPSGCPWPEGAIKEGESIVDNVQLIHQHFATDYSIPGAPVVCKTCSAMPGDEGMLPSLAIQRIHRYKDIDLRGSFGPGVFMGYDLRLTLESEHDSAEFWDPAERYALDLTDPDANGVEDGIYLNEAHSAIKDLRLYDITSALTSDELQARTAVLTTHDGMAYTFELFTVEPEPTVNYHGRLIRQADRNNNAIVIAYLYPVASTDDALGYDRNRLFQIATVTDAYGLSASFQYTWANGGWVVQSIDLPNQTSLTYTYNENALIGLNRVDYPDGAVSSFSAALDPIRQAQVVSIDDAGAEGTHRRKEVYLTLISWTSTPGQMGINQPSNRVRRVVNGAGEISYMNWITSDANDIDKSTYVYEGGGVDGDGAVLRYDTHDGVPDKTWRAKSWDLTQPLSTYTWELVKDHTANVINARLTEGEDSLGRKTTYQLDPVTGAIVGQQRFATNGALYAQESATYNQFRQPLTRTDRLGRVTDFDYDAKGNLLLRKVAQNTLDAGVWAYTYNPIGQVETATDANGNVTTYHYNAAGFLTSIDNPPDIQGGAAGTRHFSYDTEGRLQSSTDEMGRVTTFSYDNRNRIQQITYSDSSTELFTYGTGQGGTDDANLLIAFKDRNDKVTAYQYDGAGRRTRSALQIIVNGIAAEDDIRTWAYLDGTDLPRETTENGEQTTYAYDHRKRLVSNTRRPNAGVPLTTTFHYDAHGRMDIETDPYDRRTYRVFDIDDRVIRTVRETVPGGVSNPAGVATLARNLLPNAPFLIEDITYDVEGQVLSRIDGRGITTTFAYDGQGRMVQRIEAAGTPAAGRTEYDYDAQGNRIEVRHPRHFTEPGGFRSEYTYTGRNLLASITEAFGRPEAATETYSYDLSGRRIQRIDARGASWATLWSECCGYKLGEVDPSGAARIRNHDALDHTTHEYVTANVAQLSSEAEFHDPPATLNEVTTRYDARYRPIARTVWLVELGFVDESAPPIAGDPGFPATDGLTTRWVYDDNLADGIGLDATYALASLGFGPGADGSAVEETNPANEKSVMVYDGLGRAVLAIDGNGNASRIAYDQVSGGLIETVYTDALGHARKERTDGGGRARALEDAEGKVTSVGFDANGNRVSQRDANNTGADCLFDERNREKECTDTQGDKTKKGYDAHGNVVTATDGLDHSSTCVFDARNRKAACTDRIGATTFYGYDGNSNLTEITDAEGGMTSYVYDARNLLHTETFPDGGSRIYGYDAARRLASRLDQVGVTTTYQYDRANRLSHRVYPDGLNDDFVYDAAGRMLEGASQRYGNTVTRTYDAGGRLLLDRLTIAGLDYDVSHTYDAANRPVSVTYPNGQVVTRAFTARNQLDSVSLGGAPVASFVYDNGGRRVTTAFGNNLVESRTYRPDNRLNSIVTPGVTSFSYSWDKNKRKTVENDASIPDNVQGFGYDNEDRLTSFTRKNGQTQAVVQAQSWTLSEVGDWEQFDDNGSVQARDHNDVHELVGINGVALGYDDKGNLTSDHEGKSYTWDVENRLASASVPANPVPVAVLYRYDALGRRVEKVVNGQTTRFVHDGAQVVVEYHVGAADQRVYVYGSYVDEPLVFVSGGAVYYVHANHLYSPQAVSDGGGSVVERYRYDAYGNRAAMAGDGAAVAQSGIGFRRGFTGYDADGETELYYARARMYSVELGRFIRRDPNGHIDGLGLYNGYFVPSGVDPAGLCIPGVDCPSWYDGMLSIGDGFSYAMNSVSFGLVGNKDIDWNVYQHGHPSQLGGSNGNMAYQISMGTAAGAMVVAGVVVAAEGGMALASAGLDALPASAQAFLGVAANVPAGAAALTWGGYGLGVAGTGYGAWSGYENWQEGNYFEATVDGVGAITGLGMFRGGAQWALGRLRTPCPNLRAADRGGNVLDQAGLDRLNKFSPVNDGIFNLDPTYIRPSGYRAGTRDAAVRNARTADGSLIDPLGSHIDPSQPWDMGHRPGLKFEDIQRRAAEEGWSRETFMNYHNNPLHYRPELPSTNRSHVAE